MRRFGQIVFFALVLCFLIGCKEKKFIYNLNKPDARIVLSEKLNEISGLEFVSDSVLVSVQDEKAIVYYLDPITGKIIEELKFGKNGDFEGIACTENKIYVLRSDGTIFKIRDKKDAKEYEFKHDKGFDFEGLCYDAKEHRLLVACKEHRNKDKQDNIYIYSYDLESKKYDKKPLFKIDCEKVHVNFKPSAISIHPNGTIYVLSSYSKTLLVIGSDGSIVFKSQLKSLLFNQPEGIAFSKNGDMFISNESKEAVPMILRFVMSGGK